MYSAFTTSNLKLLSRYTVYIRKSILFYNSLNIIIILILSYCTGNKEVSWKNRF